MNSIKDWLIDSPQLPPVVAEQVAAVADVILGWPELQGFNPASPDTRIEGLLQCLFELQQGLSALTGLDQVALSVDSIDVAASAFISMLSKHTARAQLEQSLWVVGELQQTLSRAVEQSGFAVSLADDWADRLRGGSAPTALLIPLAHLYDETFDVVGLNAWRERGGVVLVDGLDQVFLPWPRGDQALPVDALLLDQSMLFDVAEASPALLAAERMAPYLPTPIMASVDGHVVRHTVQQRPLSIGPYYAGIGPVASLIHCFSALSLHGLRGLQQRAIASVVANRYILQKVEKTPQDDAKLDRLAMHRLTMTIAGDEQISSGLIGRFIHQVSGERKLDLTGLADLNVEGIETLAEELLALNAVRLV